MLTIRTTEQLTGVIISGDYWDLVSLIDAISEIIGDEGRYYAFQGSRNRHIRLLNELRKAKSAEKSIEFVGNGLNRGIKHERNVVGPEKNIYYSVKILLPEIIFIAISLNDFIYLHQQTIDDSDWNIEVATIRYFQSLIANVLEKFMDEEQYTVFIMLLHTKRPAFFRYATQYVDVLNIEYLKLSVEERKESIPAFAIRYLAEDEGYEKLKEQLMSISSLQKKELHEYEITLRYPEIIEW